MALKLYSYSDISGFGINIPQRKRIEIDLGLLVKKLVLNVVFVLVIEDNEIISS